MFHRIAACASLLTALLLPAAAGAQAPLSADEARALAKEAYIYGYPLVDHYRIQYAYFVDQGGPEYKGPWNQVHHTARVYTPADRAIQSPNSDTPYSFIGADLRAEPLVISVPAVEPARYYSAQFVDAYTHNFAFVGSRATGNGAGRFLLAGPRWTGDKPAGVDHVIRSETEFAYVMWRTQLFGPQDIDNVRKVQAGYRVQTLSAYLGQPAPAAAAAVEFARPLTVPEQRSSLRFFELLNFVLQFCPPHASEQALRQRLARLGVGPGLHVEGPQLTPELRAAVEAGMADAWVALAALDARMAKGEVTSRDLFGSRERLRNNYLYRMRGASGGIYGMDAEEALYPVYYADAAGRPLDGSKRYALRFAPGQLPPANAFWSLTMYELPLRNLVANAVDRYLINSPMLPALQRDADGALTLYIQRESPGADKQSNWLPAPPGPFFVALRLYGPKPEALNGQWQRPPLQMVDGAGR